MSNRRGLREMNGGRLTRPRSEWASKARGPRTSPLASGMLAGLASVLGGRSRLFLMPRRGDR